MGLASILVVALLVVGPQLPAQAGPHRGRVHGLINRMGQALDVSDNSSLPLHAQHRNQERPHHIHRPFVNMLVPGNLNKHLRRNNDDTHSQQRRQFTRQPPPQPQAPAQPQQRIQKKQLPPQMPSPQQSKHHSAQRRPLSPPAALQSPLSPPAALQNHQSQRPPHVDYPAWVARMNQRPVVQRPTAAPQPSSQNDRRQQPKRELRHPQDLINRQPQGF